MSYSATSPVLGSSRSSFPRFQAPNHTVPVESIPGRRTSDGCVFAAYSVKRSVTGSNLATFPEWYSAKKNLSSVDLTIPYGKELAEGASHTWIFSVFRSHLPILLPRM